jgi:hypothetical protein
MKVKDLDALRAWVYAQLEEWAQDKRNASDDWATSSKENKEAKQREKQFLAEKKKEFDRLLSSGGWND